MIFSLFLSRFPSLCVYPQVHVWRADVNLECHSSGTIYFSIGEGPLTAHQKLGCWDHEPQGSACPWDNEAHTPVATCDDFFPKFFPWESNSGPSTLTAFILQSELSPCLHHNI